MKKRLSVSLVLFLMFLFTGSLFAFAQLASEPQPRKPQGVLFSKETLQKRKAKKAKQQIAKRQKKEAKRLAKIEKEQVQQEKLERALKASKAKTASISQPSDNKIAKPSEEKVTTTQASSNSSYIIFDEIPESYLDYSTILLPQENLITVKNKISVKGFNKMQTETFVNGENVRLRSDGGFFQEIDLLKEGKQSILVTFTTPDNSFFSVKRKVVKLYTPSDIDKYSYNRKQFIYFFNTDYIFNPNRERQLSDKFTRGDLAYLVSMILKDKYKAKYKANFEDVPKESWMYPFIGFVAKKKYMLEFPDGDFKPNEQVNKLELVVTLVRALELDFDQSNQSISFSDINSNHWSAKFIRTALSNNIIEPSTMFYPDQLMTISDMIDVTGRLSVVREELDHIVDFESGFEMDNDALVAVFSPVESFIEERKDQIKALRRVDFDTPSNGDIVFTESIDFSGTVFPAEPFTIQGQEIIPDLMGKFKANFHTFDGRNNFVVDALGSTSNVTVFKLTSYSDLNTHWVRSIAAQFRYMGITEDTDLFQPRKNVDKLLFSHLLSNAFDLEPSSTFEVDSVSDVSISNEYYNDLMNVLQNKIMSLDSKGNFYPEKLMPRASVITAVVRAVELMQPEIKNQTFKPVAFPFWDVSKTHWARPYIQKALNWGILSPSNQFRPKDIISKAEYAAVLSRTSVVKEKTQFIFAE
jgi:hypothetical protein